MSSHSLTNGPRLLNLVFVLLLLCQVAFSARSVKYKSGHKNTSVTLTKNPHWKAPTLTDTAKLVHVYGKLNRTLPAHLNVTWDKEKKPSKHSRDFRSTERDVGSQPDLAYGYYVFPFGIGTPAKTFSLIFDTGSSDLWTWGSMRQMQQYYPDIGYNEYASLEGHNYYNISESSTAVALPGETFQVFYGNTAYGGDVGFDTTWIDDLEITDTIVPWIWWEYGAPWLFDTYPGVDGILGLGLAYWDGEIPDSRITFSSYLFPQLWYLAGFTTCFIEGVSATVDIAFIDDAKYTGALTYTPAAANTPFWTFTWSGFSIGPSAFTSSSVSVVISTGDTMMLLPPSVIAAWQSKISFSAHDSLGLFYYPCSTILPDITFGIGNARFTLPGNLFNAGGYSTIGCTAYCFASLSSSGDENLAFFGMPFYHTFFVVHDMGAMRIGVAELNKAWF